MMATARPTRTLMVPNKKTAKIHPIKRALNAAELDEAAALCNHKKYQRYIYFYFFIPVVLI